MAIKMHCVDHMGFRSTLKGKPGEAWTLTDDHDGTVIERYTGGTVEQVGAKLRAIQVLPCGLPYDDRPDYATSWPADMGA